MTRSLPGRELADAIRTAHPDAVAGVLPDAVLVAPSAIREVALHLRDHPDLAFDYLLSLTAVDYIDYFEVVYHLLSLDRNLGATLKCRLLGRENLSLPSLVPVFKAADFQEREVWDLLGIRFEGHPSLKRIMMWEGFPAHPLRKDFLEFDHRTFGATQSSVLSPESS